MKSVVTMVVLTIFLTGFIGGLTACELLEPTEESGGFRIEAKVLALEYKQRSGSYLTDVYVEGLGKFRLAGYHELNIGKVYVFRVVDYHGSQDDGYEVLSIQEMK